MEKKSLVVVMIVFVIIGVIMACVYGKITNKIANIGMLIAAIYFVIQGMKLNKESPNKTIKVFKSVKVGKFTMFMGVIVFIGSLISLFVG
ncbi:MAG: hypothetical protein K9L86_04605 [Candidatus Omnitrophica bacterium]|nr:hypothetical protein [Candidatus Omnitrophota bacterium]